ncbi:hypothetical protein [Microbacterium sp. NPDC087665]|uniref:hypothetical protein n=1 Tax=Microbacterium sp. NPDC087665 TaxID=3364194 RepID=UPI003806E340
MSMQIYDQSRRHMGRAAEIVGAEVTEEELDRRRRVRRPLGHHRTRHLAPP